jgi:hypothetical protein
MEPLPHNLNLQNAEDQDLLLERLKAAGIYLDPAALRYSVSELSDDWAQISAGLFCSLRLGAKGSEGIGFTTWLDAIKSIFEFRAYPRFNILIQRLTLPSHEKLDTLFVLQVARRYHLRGFAVTFEPFTEATTDLLVQKDDCRLYIEIKRENLSEHHRMIRLNEISNIINGALDTALRAWLRERHLRLEVKIPSLFSDPHARKVIQEITATVPTMDVGTEKPLQSVSEARMMLLPEDAEFFYRKGMHTGRVEVGLQPVLILVPSSTPIRCTFVLKPNLDALGKRIRQAGRQLKRDLERDSSANGFVVLECRLSDNEVVDAIQHRFWPRLPAGCLGVVLIAPSGWVIPHPSLPAEGVEILKYAAIEPTPG